MPKIKNILIFTAIGAAIILIYVFFIRSSPEEATLVSSSPFPLVPGAPDVPGGATTDNNSAIARDFLALLLSVKSIKLDDSIFSENAFASLRDSTITLTPDGTEGRPNPFAPLGTDNVEPPTITLGSGPTFTPPPTPASPTTPTTPAPSTPITPTTPTTPTAPTPAPSTPIVP